VQKGVVTHSRLTTPMINIK